MFSKFPDEHPTHIYRGVPPGGFVGRLAPPLVSLLEIRERVLEADILPRSVKELIVLFLPPPSPPPPPPLTPLDLAGCLKPTVALFGNEESREGAQAFMGLFEGPRILNGIVILIAI